MKKWTLRCSVCKAPFEIEAPVAPVLSEKAPAHSQPDNDAPCLGIGQPLIRHASDN